MSDLPFSEEQLRAADSGAPALAITAGAGSGKTEVICRRVQRLLEADPNGAGRILAVSYTSKAADEMRERLEERIGDVGRRVDCETIHQFAHRLLRKYGTWVGLPAEPQTIVNDDDRAQLLAQWLPESELEAEELRSMLHEIDLARARDSDHPHLVTWRDALVDVGAVDYPAMIDRAIEVLGTPGSRRQTRRLYEHVIVDEAQNLTKSQYHLLQALCGEPPLTRPTLTLVGDTKQSILSFAGADASLITRFIDSYDAEQITLTNNYRSAAAITAITDAVGEELGHPPSDRAVGHPAPGLVMTVKASTERNEGELTAQWIEALLAEGLPSEALAPREDPAVRPEDIAVIGRTAASLRETGAALERQGIGFAEAIRPEDWVTSPAAIVVRHAIAWQAGDQYVAARRLASLLDMPKRPKTFDEVISALHRQGGALAALTSALDHDDLAYTLAAIDSLKLDLEPAEREVWSDDQDAIRDAWASYCRDADISQRTWAGFNLHLTRVQRSADLTDGVRLMTIHKSQGREFRAVTIVGLNEGQLPDFRNSEGEGLKAELRAFYVAVSRPSRVLRLTRANERQTRYGTRLTERSQFCRFFR